MARKRKTPLTPDEELAVNAIKRVYPRGRWRKKLAETLEEHMAARPSCVPARRWYRWYRNPFGLWQLNQYLGIARRLYREGRI